MRSRDKFVELAEKRVNNALKYIRLIGNLSNRSNYVYTNDQVVEIFKSLEDEVRLARDKFKAMKSENNKKLFQFNQESQG